MFPFASRAARQLLSVLMISGILLAAACQRPPREAEGSSGTSGSADLRFAPRHDLSRDEEAGGHTLRQHLARSDDQLRERLAREPNIAAASTYTDRETAERVIGLVLLQNRDRITHWLSRQGGHPNLVLDYDGNSAELIGRSLRRGDDQPQPCSRATVVLKWSGGGEYYVLTSYPECR